MERSDIGRWGANTPHHNLPDEGGYYAQDGVMEKCAGALGLDW